MRKKRDAQGRTDVEVVQDFAKAKGLPTVSRVQGGGARIHHRMPDRVEVITGRNLPYQSVGRLSLEAERRGMDPDVLAEELGLIEQPIPSLPARIGRKVTEFLGLDHLQN